MKTKSTDPLAFVDVETTGGSPERNRVIEVGIWRIEKGKLAEKYESLVNPQTHLPEWITQLTGIQPETLREAPIFEEIAPQVYEMLDGATFVAHHARFDYAFLRSEFLRIGSRFTRPVLCTARMFRKLTPGLPHHNLDALMDYYEISCKARHRAMDDAKVLWGFFKKAPKIHGAKVFDRTIGEVLDLQTLPEHINGVDIESLPELPGVYIFKDADDQPIYVGKSINIRSRILAHFSSDTNGKELRMNQLVKKIETKITCGELGALLLEAELVKRLLPTFNRKLREAREMAVAYETELANGYLGVEVMTAGKYIERADKILGAFRSERAAKDFLNSLAQEYQLCTKLLGLEKGKGACFGSQIERCKGACCGREKPIYYNLRFNEAFNKTRVARWPYPGKIIIEEKGKDKGEAWVVDMWQMKAKIIYDEAGENITEVNQGFDWDTYQILKQFLRADTNKRIVVKPWYT